MKRVGLMNMQEVSLKKIYIDLSIAHVNKGFVSGAGEYAMTVCANLAKERVNLLVGYHEKNKYPWFPFLSDNQTVSRYKDYNTLKKELIEKHVEIVYFPQLLLEHIQLELPQSIRVVATLHDLGEILDSQLDKINIPGFLYNLNRIEIFKKQVKKKIYGDELQEIIKKQTAVLNHFKNFDLVTVSHFSKATINFYIKDFKRKINVFYSPAKISKMTYSESLDNTIKEKFGIEENRYFLFCNVSRPRKNNTIAIMALDDFFSNVNIDYKAVLLGSNEEYTNFILKKLKNKKKFVILPYLNSEKLEELYKFAHLFVFPSVLEGFGYPPIEAMKYGTLCACSNVCSMPEICQNGVIFFNPYDLQSIKIAYYLSLDEKFAFEKKIQAKTVYENIDKRHKKDLETLIEIIKNDK